MVEMKLERYGYRAFNAGIGSCHLVANPGPNDQNPEPLVTEASALEEIAAASFILSLIADGYFVGVDDGQFIKIGNPYYEPDNGQDPFIVFDAKPNDDDDDDGPGSCGPGQLSEVF